MDFQEDKNYIEYKKQLKYFVDTKEKDLLKWKELSEKAVLIKNEYNIPWYEFGLKKYFNKRRKKAGDIYMRNIHCIQKYSKEDVIKLRDAGITLYMISFVYRRNYRERIAKVLSSKTENIVIEHKKTDQRVRCTAKTKKIKSESPKLEENIELDSKCDMVTEARKYLKSPKTIFAMFCELTLSEYLSIENKEYKKLKNINIDGLINNIIKPLISKKYELNFIKGENNDNDN